MPGQKASATTSGKRLLQKQELTLNSTPVSYTHLYYGEETVFKVTNCSVTGSIDGAVTPGTVAGRAVGSVIESCDADILIDGVHADNQICLLYTSQNLES